ncbi:MAG TPA: hypothetical protein VKT22_00550 [Steroidobacteraceae bacterium]|nr:hypothetical protein [Steroidobacteraceae bacterium]
MSGVLRGGRPAQVSGLLASILLVGGAARAAHPDDDEKAPAARTPSSTPAAGPVLNADQARAVGLEIARPQAARAAGRTAALGLVLDPAALRSDLDALRVAAAAEQAAALELKRLEALYAGGAQASARMVETAEAEHAKARAGLGAARARLTLGWGPIATWRSEAQDELATRLIDGRALLVRADLPGRHSWGALPAQALVDVDGVEVPGRVLGALRAEGATQSAALLLELSAAPTGLGAGARLPVALLNEVRAGRVLPRSALLYDEHGPYVYKQASAAAAGSPARYVPLAVRLIAPYGAGWLVEGIDDDDEIVVSGAGVLWSLKDLGNRSSEDDED